MSKLDWRPAGVCHADIRGHDRVGTRGIPSSASRQRFTGCFVRGRLPGSAWVQNGASSVKRSNGGSRKRRAPRALQSPTILGPLALVEDIEPRHAVAVSSDRPQTAASVSISAISYRARCIEASCTNRARVQMVYADAGGLPIAHPVVCNEHARRGLARVMRLL